MNYYLVLGATNEVLDYADIYPDEELAVKAAKHFLGKDTLSLSSGSVISFKANGISRRTLYLPVRVDATKLPSSIYVLVRSVPYLHNTTKARVFFDEQEAKAEAHNFNTAVSRTYFHAYLFTFNI